MPELLALVHSLAGTLRADALCSMWLAVKLRALSELGESFMSTHTQAHTLFWYSGADGAQKPSASGCATHSPNVKLVQLTGALQTSLRSVLSWI